MSLYRLFYISVFACFCLVVSSGDAKVFEGGLQKAPKRIAITLDDAPMGPTKAFQSALQRAFAIVDPVGKQTPHFRMGVFAVGRHINAFGAADLFLYSKEGHVIANHTFSHSALSKQGAKAFTEDVILNHRMLSEIPGFKPYLRFPYLDEGRGEAQEVLSSLSNLAYQSGYVTISTHDWYANKIFLQAIGNNDQLDYREFGRLYVELIVEGTEFVANECLKQGVTDVVHILLLHANDVNAVIFLELLTAFQQKGWQFVDMDLAYELNKKKCGEGCAQALRNVFSGMKSPYLDLKKIEERFEEGKIKLR